MADDEVMEGERPRWAFTITDLEPDPTRVARPTGAVRPSPAPVSHDFEDIEDTIAHDSATLVPINANDSVPSLRIKHPRVSDDSTDIEIGQGMQVVDRYVIEETIASGGMGRIHRVKHLHLGKHFALKEIHDNLSGDENFRAKFYQEARLASGLSHRNIVSIVDFGEDPNMGLFMVMELVEGEPLTRRLRNRESLPIRMACEIILQVADALHYIHSKGILHGDIKPDNILLRRAGRSELRRWNVCLLDFGLARPRHAAIVDEEHIEGTPAYMAPEVICGEPMREASDIYSLGVLAYHLVTGHPPFRGDLRHIMSMHLKTKPPPLRELLGEEVDERLEALIMKALEKDPKNRQASMAAFLFEMKTLMDMLGFGRRRGAKSGSGKALDSDPVKSRLAKLAFEQCGFGVAVLDREGEVVVANSSLVRFFRWDKNDGRKQSVLDPRFLRIHPEMAADLRDVRERGAPIRRLLAFTSGSHGSVELLFTLSCLEGEKDKLLLSIVPIS